MNITELSHILQDGIKDFWSFKEEIGDLLEVITPLVTLNDEYVSVFVAERNGEYVVTDGGWILDDMYNLEVFPVDISNKTIETLRDVFDVKLVETLFYKKCEDFADVLTCIIDVAHFVQAVVNQIYMNELVPQSV